jgi:VCBS repeat-containing protein
MMSGSGAGDTQIAAASTTVEAPYEDALPQPLDTAQVVVPQGENVVREPVTPGEVVELPFPADSQFLARIDNGNLAIKVGDVTVILQGYVEAAGQTPPVIEASNGQPLDIATILASTDPNIDIQTAAGPAAGAQGADNTGAILAQFGGGAGLGGFNGAGALDATDGLGGGTVDQTGTLFRQFGLVTPDTAPVTQDDAYKTNEDTVLNIAAPGVLGNDSDPDGDPLTAALLTGPAHGTLAINADGSFTYTPDKDYNGPDSFTYQADDGKGGVTPATVNITVDPVNDAPVAADDTATTNEDTPITIAVLTNDTDVDGDALTPSVVTGPAHGTLTANPDGTFTYTPDANYHGADSFTYKANDGTVDSNTATVNITVNSVNDAPVAANDPYTTAEDTPLVVPAGTGVLNNDTDVEGDPLTAVLVTGPAHGTLAINADGSFTYTPNKDYNGPDSFTYKANDGTDNSNLATVSINVTPVNDAPQFAGGQYAYGFPEDAKGTAELHWIIKDVDDPAGPFTITVKDPGTLPDGVTYDALAKTFTVDAKGKYDYLADGETLTFTIPMLITDPHGASSEKNFTLTITGTDDAVDAVDDTVLTNVGVNASFVMPEWAVIANDKDVSTEDLSFPGIGTLVGGTFASHSVGVGTNGNLAFGDDATLGGSFKYQLVDGSEATITVHNQAGGDLTGTTAHEIIVSGAAGDKIDGKGGKDLIFGGDGDDTVIFHNGDTVVGGTDSIAASNALATSATRGDVLALDHDVNFVKLDLTHTGGIETISTAAADGGAGAQSITVGAATVTGISDHTITPGGLFAEHLAVRIDGDAVDQLYLSISKDGAGTGWADTGIDTANGYHVYAHETTAGDATTADSYVMVANTVPAANVHLNQDQA